MNPHGGEDSFEKYAQEINAHFLETVCQQNRQCVTSGPAVGNCWSTKLAPEQGIKGGGVCAVAKREEKESTNAHRVIMETDRKYFIGPSPFPHKCALPSDLHYPSYRLQNPPPCR